MCLTISDFPLYNASTNEGLVRNNHGPKKKSKFFGRSSCAKKVIPVSENSVPSKSTVFNVFQ
uniref:Uncharacterized protein n=1 Tax=Anguilla anguilla TaxID=7936 RepID=A0A0E9XZJ1_ANGAN